MLMWARRAGADARTALRLAASQDHIGALSLVAPTPIAVESKLGLHLAVLSRGSARTRVERRCTALAHAELGEVGAALQLIGPKDFGWRRSDRIQFATSVGRWSPTAAMAYAPRQATLVRCALALRSGLRDEAERLLHRSQSTVSADREALVAALAAAHGRHRQARHAANRMFESFGIPSPLDAAADAPISLQEFEFHQKSPVATTRVDRPKVSIILPVRNAAASVATAIRSVLHQSWVNLELIVIDDASDDGTPAVINDAIGSDPRARHFRHATRGGAYAARNTGMALATGDFVTFQDADDWSYPERIARGVAPLLSSPDLMATQSRLIRLDAQGQFVAPRVFPFVRANLSSLLFRRAPVLSALGGFEEVPFGADEEFIGRLTACFGGNAMQRLPILLAIATQSASTLTGSAVTGVGSMAGNRQRIAYREMWHRRHVDVFETSRRASQDVTSPRNKSGTIWRISNEAIGRAQLAF